MFDVGDIFTGAVLLVFGVQQSVLCLKETVSETWYKLDLMLLPFKSYIHASMLC